MTDLIEQKALVPTTLGSRDIDISSINRVEIIAVEYPIDKLPRRYPRFALWRDTLTILGEEIPDGSSACVYYSEQELTRRDRTRIRSLYKPDEEV